MNCFSNAFREDREAAIPLALVSSRTNTRVGAPEPLWIFMGANMAYYSHAWKKATKNIPRKESRPIEDSRRWREEDQVFYED